MATTSKTVTNQKRILVHRSGAGETQHTVKFVANYTVRPDGGTLDEIAIRYKVAQEVVKMWYDIAVRYYEGNIPEQEEWSTEPIHSAIPAFEPMGDDKDPLCTIFGNIVHIVDDEGSKHHNRPAEFSLSFNEMASEYEIWTSVISHHYGALEISDVIECEDTLGRKPYSTEVVLGNAKPRKQGSKKTQVPEIVNVASLTDLGELGFDRVFRMPVSKVALRKVKNAVYVDFDAWAFINDQWRDAGNAFSVNAKYVKDLKDIEGYIDLSTNTATFGVPKSENALVIHATKKKSNYGGDAYYVDVTVEK